MRRIALLLAVTAAAVAAVFSGKAAAGSTAAQACPGVRPGLGYRVCKGTATIRIGTSVKHYTGVACIIEKTTAAPVYVGVRKGFVITINFPRHSRTNSVGTILTTGPNKTEIDESIKARLSANRHNATFTGVDKSPKLTGSFTCK